MSADSAHICHRRCQSSCSEWCRSDAPSSRQHRLVSGAEHQTLHEVLLMAEEGWQLYPIYGVDADGVCACPKGATCPNPGKHPTTPLGFNDASSDPKRIAEMFARWPGDNVGHKTGRASGTVIIDVDPRNGGMETLGRLQAEHGYFPPTRLHVTGGGGFHFALRYPESVNKVPSRPIGPGVEVKADGAGVVLPPSNHASGGKYEVLVDAPLAPLPSWIVEMARELRVLAGGAEQPTESRFKLPERIYETASPRNRSLRASSARAAASRVYSGLSLRGTSVLSRRRTDRPEASCTLLSRRSSSGAAACSTLATMTCRAGTSRTTRARCSPSTATSSGRRSPSRAYRYASTAMRRTR